MLLVNKPHKLIFDVVICLLTHEPGRHEYCYLLGTFAVSLHQLKFQ